MVDKADAERFVTGLYRGVLRRDPDPEGLAHYSAELMGGRPHAELLEKLMASQEFQSVDHVKLFVPPGHFLSPIVPPDEGTRQLRRIEGAPRPRMLPTLGLDPADITATWNKLLPFLTSNPFSDAPSTGLRYSFDNPAYAIGDGSILHGMLRFHRPKRMIEIGSGWSSACSLDTIEKYEIDCQLTFIEPYPKLLRSLLTKTDSHINLIESQVQEVALETFDQLESGDVLFIDSTHVVRTGSDVCYEVFEIMPRLKSGVIVHFHDIFWPFEYPRSWVIDENRSWNELYLLRAFLAYNRDWKIIFFNDYMGLMEEALVGRTYPQFLRNPGGALWLERA